MYSPISKFDEINITKALTQAGRLHYPKVARKCKIDELLQRRMQLKLLEERQIAQKEAQVGWLSLLQSQSCVVHKDGSLKSTQSGFITFI